jgi:hypothetical protein
VWWIPLAVLTNSAKNLASNRWAIVSQLAKKAAHEAAFFMRLK